MPGFFKGFHNHGRRNTMPRTLILEFLASHPDKHFSAKEIYEALLNNNIYIGIASVYRNVELLSNLGYIKKYNFDDGSYRYQYKDMKNEHHHIICKESGKIIDFNIDKELSDKIEDLKKRLEKEYGVIIDDYELKFYGNIKKE